MLIICSVLRILLTNSQPETCSISYQDPSGSFLLWRRDQTGPDDEQEAKGLGHPTRESRALRLSGGSLPEPHSPKAGDKASSSDQGKYATYQLWSRGCRKQMRALSTWDNTAFFAYLGEISQVHCSTHLASVQFTGKALFKVWGTCPGTNSTSLPSHGNSYLYKCFLVEIMNTRQRLTDVHNREAMWVAVKRASENESKTHPVYHQWGSISTMQNTCIGPLQKEQRLDRSSLGSDIPVFSGIQWPRMRTPQYFFFC